MATFAGDSSEVSESDGDSQCDEEILSLLSGEESHSEDETDGIIY